MEATRPELPVVIYAQKVFRTGHQLVGRDAAGRPWVRLLNRSNYTWVEIPEEKVSTWVQLLS